MSSKRIMTTPHHNLGNLGSGIFSMEGYKVVQMQCPHRDDHRQKLTQTQDGIRYVIASCDLCKEIALKSNCGFDDISDMKMAQAKGGSTA